MTTSGTNIQATAGGGPFIEREGDGLRDRREKSFRGALEWIVPALFIVVLLAQLLCSVRRLSQTSDEADHLHAGYRYWQCVDLLNPEHPPLVKLVAAAPLHFGNFRDPLPMTCDVLRMRGIDFEAARRFLFSTPDPQAVLFRARAAVSVFAIALLIVVWIAARRMFGFTFAVIASILVVFEPNLLAHGALVATDVGVTFGMLWAIYVFYRYTERPSAFLAVLLGLACAVTFTTKLSGLLLVPMLVVLAGSEPFVQGTNSDRKRRVGLNFAGVGAALVVSVLLLWAAYGFRYSAHPAASTEYGAITNAAPGGAPASEAVPEILKHLLPENFVIGVSRIWQMSEQGRVSYVLGHLYPKGRWFYFPIALLIKTTVAFLLLFGLSLGSWRFWERHRKQALFLLVPPILYLLPSLNSNLNSGVRHVLPMLPFLLLFAAAGACNIMNRGRWAKYAVGILLWMHAASSLHAYPYYISYANELWGGPSKVNRYLTDSNSDWGQGLLAARDYLSKYPDEPCWAVYSYYIDIRDYGIRCYDLEHARFFRSDQLEPLPTRLSGIFLISGMNLSGVDAPEAGVFLAKPFVNATPAATIAGGSMFVYRGDFDTTIPAGMRQIEIVQHDLREGDVQAAISAAQRAVELIPHSGHAHTAYCAALNAGGHWEQAAAQCQEALAILNRNRVRNAGSIENVLALMKSAGMPLPSGAAQH